MSLQAYLSTQDANYDPALRLVWQVAHTPGYHTRIADGTRAHPTRESMDYALALLLTDEPTRIERANDVIDAIVSLQQTDPTAEHYGIWGWFGEEPPQAMNPADWNWADFIGIRLLQALVLHGPTLRTSTADGARSAAHHAAMSIFRRNVRPAYTNIAVMGAVTSAVAGEVLGLPFLLDYGRGRLRNVLEEEKRIGGFSEYNSPTYTRVALEEAERCLMLVRDNLMRDAAEELRRICWRSMAERFHPGTGQMAGPNSRAYTDYLQPALVKYLSEQTGIPITPRLSPGETMNRAADGSVELVTALPCPPESAARFARLPVDPLEVVTRFSSAPEGDTIGTTWLTADACLGSVNRGISFVQQRPLLAYWVSGSDPAACLRARLLKSGRDLSAGAIQQAQRGPRMLSAWRLSYDGGDFHPTLNRPPGSVYRIADLRLRISLQGQGVEARPLSGDRFELSAGSWRAVIHTGAAAFAHEPARWLLSREVGLVQLDAVLYDGPEKAFDFHDTLLELAFAVELLRRNAPPAENDLRRMGSNEHGTWAWNELRIDAPIVPTRFRW